jgi:hypothetical protein
MVDGSEFHFPEPADVASHRLARDRAPRRPDKELFEGILVGLPGVRRAHGIADQLLRPLNPVHAGLGKGAQGGWIRCFVLFAVLPAGCYLQAADISRF